MTRECNGDFMAEFLILLPFSTGRLRELGLGLAARYLLLVAAVWNVARQRASPWAGPIAVFATVAGLTGWGFLLAFWLAWATGRNAGR